MRRVTNAAFLIEMEMVISIHTLHAEGDFVDIGAPNTVHIFLSTPSMRRVTREQVEKVWRGE